jgi:hypothetical protein
VSICQACFILCNTYYIIYHWNVSYAY